MGWDFKSSSGVSECGSDPQPRSSVNERSLLGLSELMLSLTSDLILPLGYAAGYDDTCG